MKSSERHMDSPLVAIVVLNWNGWRDTIECLESLFQMSYPNFRVVVVDNGSTDDSISKIKEWAAGKIEVESKYFKFNPANKPIPNDRLFLISLEENLGFARGNNIGIKYAFSKGDVKYILILNNDTVVKPDFLFYLVEVFDRYPKVGLAGPKIIDYYTGIHWQGVLYKRIDFLTCIMFLTPLRWFFTKTIFVKPHLLKNGDPQLVYAIGGCCMFFKKDAIEKIGFFDEATFLGYEEYIIAEKLSKYGYSTYAVPKSIVYHKVMRGTLKIPLPERVVTFLKSENYFLKNYLKMPYFQRFLIRIIRLILYLVAFLTVKSHRKGLGRMVSVLFKEI